MAEHHHILNVKRKNQGR